MNDHEVEIVVGGAAAHRRADIADHVALALMSAGATVDFSARPQRSMHLGQTLRDVRVVVHVAETAPPAMLLGQDHKGFDAHTAVQIALGAVLLLVLFGAELRLRFGLRFDTIIIVAALWWFWRFCRRRTKMAS